MKPFPATPGLTGVFAPLLLEGQIADCVIEGDLPAGISGSYYRNGPNPQYPPRGPYANWYDGDGMVHAFHFRDGRVTYVNRWTRTERFEMERKAGRALFPTLFGPQTGDAMAAGKSLNAANDTILIHHGKVFSTWETGLPHELDPVTLETRGLYDFGGAIPHDVMVHPKIDPTTGELHLFGRTTPHPAPGDATYHVVDRSGKVVHTTSFSTPYDSMTHDMFLTGKYAVICVQPAVYSPTRLAAGGPYVAWEAERSSWLGVIPRRGDGNSLRWIEMPGAWGSHTMNAYDDGDTIVCDTILYPRGALFPNPDGSWPDMKTLKLPSLQRWHVDLAKGNVRQEAFGPGLGEMPVMDMRFRTRPYRHGYSAGWTRPAGMFDCIHHYDWHTRTLDTYVPGEGISCGEPAFVPRPNGAEGDGYLMTLLFNKDANSSDLAILDARHAAAGPVARVKLPHRIPAGLHGAWYPL